MVQCSHSDKESYKNLCQSDVTVTALIQLRETAAADVTVTALIQLRETAAADGGSHTTQYQTFSQASGCALCGEPRPGQDCFHKEY